MKTLLILALASVLTGCTVFHGVTDVKQTPEGLSVEKCDLNVYFALYGLVAMPQNCKSELVK